MVQVWERKGGFGGSGKGARWILVGWGPGRSERDLRKRQWEDNDGEEGGEEGKDVAKRIQNIIHSF